jgi:hypothetical protein
MSDDKHFVPFPEFDKLIREGEIIQSLFRMDVFAFHAILSDDRIEMRFNDSDSRGVFTGYLICIQCGSNIKNIVERSFQSHLLFRTCWRTGYK